LWEKAFVLKQKAMEAFSIKLKDGSSFSSLGPKRKIKFFYCKKLGHGIKECNTRIVVKPNPKKQNNIFTKDNKLYVVTFVANEECDPILLQFMVFFTGFSSFKIPKIINVKKTIVSIWTI
jgi:hypothetical protein